MSVTSGFFNSLNHDRRYDALTVSRLFDGMINDGVYSTIGEKFIVTADSGMRIMVGSGRCWFDHTWTLNDTKYPLIVEDSEQVLSRIDAVVLEVNQNEDVRENSIKIIKGAPSSNPVKPTMIKSAYLNQWPFAYITVGPDVTEITQANIENVVGTSECPFANALLTHVTTDELILQWKAQWDEYIASAQAEATAWTAAFELRLINWSQGLRDILDQNAAGHLQNEIDALCDMISYVEYVNAVDKTTVIASKKYKYGDSVIINYGDPISPKLYFAITPIEIGDQIIAGDNVVSDRVIERVNKMFETDVFKIHTFGWSAATISKWNMNLYTYDLPVGDIFIPDGCMPDARSCGPTLDTPATETEADAFGELVDKADIDKENKRITLYSAVKPTVNFYIAINGIKGDVGAEFDPGTFAGVKKILDAGMEDRLLAPGMLIPITLTNGVTLNLQIVAINHDTEYPGQIIFSTQHSLNPIVRMHDTNDNSVKWSETELGIALNGALFYDLLPVAVKNAISPRQFWRADGNTGVTTLHQETSKIWLPRAVEVFGIDAGSAETEAATGSQFAHYAAQANRVKNVGTAAQYWWTCSPAVANGATVVLVNTNGALYGNINMVNQYGAAPHFHILANTPATP